MAEWISKRNPFAPESIKGSSMSTKLEAGLARLLFMEFIFDQARRYPQASVVHRPRERFAMSQLLYPIIVQPLPVEDGGGFAALVPDLPGCMSDGESPEEAVANVQDAIAVWIEAAIELGRTVPKPSTQLALAG